MWFLTRHTSLLLALSASAYAALVLLLALLSHGFSATDINSPAVPGCIDVLGLAPDAAAWALDTGTTQQSADAVGLFLPLPRPPTGSWTRRCSHQGHRRS